MRRSQTASLKCQVTIDELKAHFAHFKAMAKTARSIFDLEEALGQMEARVSSPKIRSEEEASYQRGTTIPQDVGLEYVKQKSTIEERMTSLNREYLANVILFTSFNQKTGFPDLSRLTKIVVWELCYNSKPVTAVAKALNARGSSMSRKSLYRLLASARISFEEDAGADGTGEIGDS